MEEQKISMRENTEAAADAPEKAPESAKAPEQAATEAGGKSPAEEKPVAERSPAGDASAAESAGVKAAENAAAEEENDEDLVPVDLHADDHKRSAEEKQEPEKGEHEKSAHEKSVRKRTRKAPDEYKRKRRKRRIVWLIVLGVLVLLGLLLYFRVIKPAKAAAQAMLGQMNETTDTIEKRDIVNSIATTGTLEANEVRTLTSRAKDTTIDSVMAEVGDHVNKGDTMVIFSTESINKTIDQLKEDLSESKRIQSIESKANDRSYLYSYTSQANDLYNSSEKVENALKNLYEACDGYGKAKRDLQEQRDLERPDEELQAYISAVNSAYQAEQQAQANYDAAVEAQAQLAGLSGNNLTKADEDHELAAIKAGDQARSLSRQIEDYQDKLDNYIITAPISGIVTKVAVEEGNGFEGGTVMVIQDTDTFKISAKIDEYDIPNVKLGQHVIIRTDATREDELDGYVSFIAPTSTTMSTGSGGTTATGTTQASSGSTDAEYEVTINVTGKDERLRVGMSAKLNIIVDQVSDVLTVPYDAIQTNADGKTYITVIEGDGAAVPAKTADAQTANDAGEGGPVLQITGAGEEEPGEKPDEKGAGFGFGAQKPPEQDNRRDIIVEVGMQGDYYTQVISNELKPGMTVVIPDSGEFDMSSFEAMFGPGF